MSSQLILIGLAVIAGIVVVLVVIYIICKRYHKSGRKRKRDVQHTDDVENGNATKRQCIRNTAIGLPNVGETCYMNAMIQCLAWSPCLRSQLEDQLRKQTYSERGRNRVAKTLLAVLESYHDDDDDDTEDDGCSGCFYTPKEDLIHENLNAFFRAISQTNDRFGGGVQEDTFEFYNALISTLQDEALEHIPRSLQDDTYDEHVMRHCGVTRLFGGRFMISCFYEKCGHVDPVFQTFTSLSIPVIKNRDGLSNSGVAFTVDGSDRTRLCSVTSGKGDSYGSLFDRGQPMDIQIQMPDDADVDPDPDPEMTEGMLDVNFPSQTPDSTQQIDVKPSSNSIPSGDKLRGGLSLANRNRNCEVTGVESGLEKLTEWETMMASDLCCRICKKKGEDGTVGIVYKTLQILSLPPVLVLQINRFQQRDRQVYKVNERVSYPKSLDMTRFCSIAMEVSGASGKLTPGETYTLFGVVNHQGTMKGGHYIAYIKTSHRNIENIQNQLQKHTWRDPEKMASSIRTHLEEIWHVNRKNERDANQKTPVEDFEHTAHQHMKPDSEIWFRVSDSSVVRVKEADVMQSKEAYILMYERL